MIAPPPLVLGVGTWIRESHMKYIHTCMTVGFCINDFLLTYFLLHIFFMVEQNAGVNFSIDQVKAGMGSTALECN